MKHNSQDLTLPIMCPHLLIIDVINRNTFAAVFITQYYMKRFGIERKNWDCLSSIVFLSFFGVRILIGIKDNGYKHKDKLNCLWF